MAITMTMPVSGGIYRRNIIDSTVPPPTSGRINGAFSSDPRLSLLLALSSQASIRAQRDAQRFALEVVKYVNPQKVEAKNLEEALMSVPDLESIPYHVLRREERYEIRQVESYVVAETAMPGSTGFDFSGSSQGFNTLAAYLFGKNSKKEEMEMTTPVLSSRSPPNGEKMEMTTPVLSQKTSKGQWKMAFVMPSKYGDDLPIPVDKSVTIRRVPSKVVAVTSFSGYVTDEEVQNREKEFRRLLAQDPKLKIKDDAQLEISQFNPPFTLPFMRRNEIGLEVEVL